MCGVRFGMLAVTVGDGFSQLGNSGLGWKYGRLNPFVAERFGKSDAVRPFSESENPLF